MTEAVAVPRTTGSVRGRVLVLGVLVVGLGWAATRTPAFVRQVAQPCPSTTCPIFERPGPDTVAALTAAGIGTTAWAVAIVVLAWISLVAGTAVAGLLLLRLATVRVAHVTAGLVALVALTPFAADLRPWFLMASAVLLPGFVGLFPTGEWVPAAMRWLWPVLVLLLVGTRVADVVFGEAFTRSTGRSLVGAGVLVVLAGCQVYRYRWVSDAEARAQTRGPLLGMLLVALAAAAAQFPTGALPAAVTHLGLVALDYAATAFTMVMLGVVLLRYRLFQIDLLVRRSMVYLGVFAVLGVGYLVVLAVAWLGVARIDGAVLRTVSVVLVAVVAGMAGLRLLRAARIRLYGFGARHGAAAAALARSLDDGHAGAESLAATIAAALAVPYAAVRDSDGRLISEHHRRPGATSEASAHRLIEVPVLAGPAGTPGDGGVSGATGGRDTGGALPGVLGRVVLRLPWGQARLSRRDEAVLEEVLPFVAVALRSDAEARLLRQAQALAVAGREEERRRLRRDLHDGVGPLLAAQLLAIDSLRLEHDPSRTANLLAQLESATNDALAETRRIARDLRPDSIEAAGLHEAVDAEAARFTDAGLPVAVDWSLAAGALREDVARTVLRIVRESLSNAARHAAATCCRVSVSAVHDGDVHVSVCDDGRGRGDHADGIGIASMRERVQAVGGRLRVDVGPSGVGTDVRAVLPR